jgi:type IV pilus assembly protein PilA
MARPSSSRTRARRLTAVELSVGFCLVASVLAVALPTFVREVHASRLVEPVDGLTRIGAAAVSYAKGHPVAQGFPASVPLTPATPPRGKCVTDPPGTWDQPTWRDLDFRPTAADAPHCFAFSFDSSLSPSVSTFRAQAHGDLDGDGIPSTFEITGRYVDGDLRGPVVDPGMFVDSEVE